MLKKFRNAAVIIKTFKNWPMLFWGYIGCYMPLFKTKVFSIGPYMVCTLRTGTKYKIRTRLAYLGDVDVIVGIWRRNITHDISRLHIPSSGVVIDIGAHIGVFSLMAANKGENVRVFAYEPEPENFSLLRDNIQLNGLQKKVIPFDMAVVGRKTEEVRKLNITDSPEAYSFYYSEGDKGINVRCTTLEHIFQENRIERCDFMKMDCEGAEYEIILNAPQSILSRINKLHLEFHEFEGLKYDQSDLINALKAAGFNVTTKTFFPRLGYIYAEREVP